MKLDDFAPTLGQNGTPCAILLPMVCFVASTSFNTHINAGALTYLPLDKMAAILADDIFQCIFLNEEVQILITISLKFGPEGLIDNTMTMKINENHLLTKLYREKHVINTIHIASYV